MSNLGKIPNNGAENLSAGLWPMPEPACASEADTAISLAGLIKVAATGQGASDGNRMSDSAPATGGNDGDIDDKVVG